jgi:hypothetical protein
MDDPIASVSQPPLHPLQVGGPVAYPSVAVPRAAESQSGIGGRVDVLTPQQQQSVSPRPNMHRPADPFAAMAPPGRSVPRGVDAFDDDSFGLTAQSSRAIAASHVVKANSSSMPHVQPRKNAEQDPPFSAPNIYGSQNAGVFVEHPHQSSMHVGPRQTAPPTQMHPNDQDLLDMNSPYAPPNSVNPSRQVVVPQMGIGGEWNQSQSQHQLPQSEHHQERRAAPAQPQVQKKEETGYRFGSITRSIVAEGKKNSGRSEKDGYKFGDFTRGLFGS